MRVASGHTGLTASESYQASCTIPESAPRARTRRTPTRESVSRRRRAPVSASSRPAAWSTKVAQSSCAAVYWRGAGGPTEKVPAPVTSHTSSARRRAQVTAPTSSRLGHERVAVVVSRRERLLHAPRRDPAQQVEHRPRLIVCAARPGPPERLLPDDRT